MAMARARWHERLTMRQKLIFYVLIVLLPVILFSIVYLFQAQRILQEKAGQLTSKSLELSTSWMDETLRGAVRLSAVIESEPVTRNFLLDHQNIPLKQLDITDIMLIQDQLEKVLNNESRATSIWIYFPDTNEVISTRFGIYSVSDYIALDWLLSQSEDGRIRSWIYPDVTTPQNAGSLLDFTPARESGNQQISFVRSIPGFGTKEKPIIIGVGYLEYTIQDLLSEAAHKTQSSLMLLNDRGNVVLQAGNGMDNDWIGAPLQLNKWQGDSAYYIEKNRLITRSRSALTGWEMVSVDPLSEYMGGMKLLNWLTIVFSLSAVIIALWMGRSLIRGIHVPLKQLLLAMKKVESGDLTARVAFTQNDEFGIMANGFNRMVEMQDHLIRTGYKERIARQTAELSYLTDQINPHFLYNTLGALYSMAKRVDDTLAESLLAMSRLFRSSLNQGKSMKSVQETVEQITNYIRLLNIRNSDKYRLELYVEPGSERIQIPSLIVQPIVENSVKHGLELLPGQGVIRISFTLLTSQLLVAISDNGIGIPDEQLNLLRSSVQDFKANDEAFHEIRADEAVSDGIEGSGYALKNIYRRLQLKYGQDFIFYIDSQEGKGTHLTLRIPREEDENEAVDRG